MKWQENTRSFAVLRTTTSYKRIMSTICLKYWGRWVAEWGGKRNSVCFYLLLLLCDWNFSSKVIIFLQWPWYDFTDSLGIRLCLIPNWKCPRITQGPALSISLGQAGKYFSEHLWSSLSTLSLQSKAWKKQQVVIYLSDYF